MKYDWKIHMLIKRGEEEECDICGKTGDEFDDVEPDSFDENPYYRNSHTHGLRRYHNRPELCITLDLPPEETCAILNELGRRIAEEGLVLRAGRHSGILSNDYDIEVVDFGDNELDDSLYLLLPDPENKFPEDTTCMEGFRDQYKFAKHIHELNVTDGNWDPTEEIENVEGKNMLRDD
jgi:hypothetical protein